MQSSRIRPFLGTPPKKKIIVETVANNDWPDLTAQTYYLAGRPSMLSRDVYLPIILTSESSGCPERSDNPPRDSEIIAHIARRNFYMRSIYIRQYWLNLTLISLEVLEFVLAMTIRTRHTENAASIAGSRAFTRTNDAALVVWRLLCITGSYYISAVEKTGQNGLASKSKLVKSAAWAYRCAPTSP